jgi:hypothetical protein
MVVVFAKADCGCCTVRMEFESIERARAEFARVGYGNGMTIRDDTGIPHSSIDTFYGFSTDEADAEGRSLGYLFNLAAGKEQA